MNDIKLSNPKYAKKCSYILQDDNLYSSFTVHETMVLAANLKIADMTIDEKGLIVSVVNRFTSCTASALQFACATTKMARIL